MFADDPQSAATTNRIMQVLGSHHGTKSHGRHIPIDRCQEIGLRVVPLEAEGNQALQDAVLTLHHACIHTLATTAASKIIENHDGAAFVRLIQPA